MSYTKKLNTVYTSQFYKPKNFWDSCLIAKGQISYHKKNYSRYFQLPIKDFKKKKTLESGSGQGIHAVILALMGGEVHAADILKSNISKTRKLKKAYKLNNLIVSPHDFRKEYKKSKKFDLIACHNWIQHCPNPGLILKNLVKNMDKGSKLYISCYLSGTFRFYITQIAREVIKFEDFLKLKKRTNIFFKKGFSIYKNPLDIYGSNIRDDFLTPYCITTTYDNLLKITKRYDLKIMTKIPKIKNLIFRDNIPLRASFVKVTKKNNFRKNKLFLNPINEFEKSTCKEKNECTTLSKKIINNIRKRSTSSQRVNFCLNLYKIRSRYSLLNNVQKYIELKKYLTNYTY